MMNDLRNEYRVEKGIIKVLFWQFIKMIEAIKNIQAEKVIFVIWVI